MNKYARYKLVVGILIAVVILQGIFLLHFLPTRPKKKALPVVVGRIAIVLDDWGYNLNNLHFLDEINYPLTISVLPHLTYSAQIASEASRKGAEVILHLPMEPLPSEKMRLENRTIMTSMTPQEVRDIFNDDVESIPAVKGVNNHMGSKAVTDATVMEVILSEMQKRNLYFLDSMVTQKSLAQSLSRKLSLPFAKRDVFLDNISDPQYIRGQIEKLKAKARIKGAAIGIGHDRRATLMVLKEVMPELEKEGYKFVFVSEVVK